MRKNVTMVGAAVAAMLWCAAAQGGMDRTRLNVGAYFLSDWIFTEQRAKEFADCNLDFVVLMQNRRDHLDVLHKYGVGAIVTKVVPGLWGVELPPGEGRIADRAKDELYEKAAAAFKDHPAIWGIDIGDEPSSIDYPHYAHVVRKFGEWFPGKLPYLNLYPNYAFGPWISEEKALKQLGVSRYRDYIAKYCATVPLDYLSYDFYVYSSTVSRAYANLQIAADACRGSGKSLWIVIQVNSEHKERWIAENGLRFQAYTAMAYGAETIMWATYHNGWWYNKVLEGNGEKTQQYEKLQRVNAELRRLGPEYMKYRSQSTFLVGSAGTNDWFTASGQLPVRQFGDEAFRGLCADDGGPLVVGSMVARSGNCDRAAFVCAADDPYDCAPQMRTVRFRCEGRAVKAYGTDGEIPLARSEDGVYSFKLQSNRAALLVGAWASKRAW